MPELTVELLTKVTGPGRDHLIRRYLPFLNKTCERFNIDTPLRLAHFLAQILHESGGLRWPEEIWPEPALDTHGVAQKGSRWQLRYERHPGLGNTEVGDGYRFRGRGLIQLTGRANYRAFGKSLGLDLEAKPDRVALEPNLAVLAAGWFWDQRGLNAVADLDDLKTITRRINGGYNGLADRERYLARAKQALGLPPSGDAANAPAAGGGVPR